MIDRPPPQPPQPPTERPPRKLINPDAVYTADAANAEIIPAAWPGDWSGWKLFTRVDATGDCMYDSLCRALNSTGEQTWTITKLRAALADCYDAGKRMGKLKEFLQTNTYPGSNLNQDNKLKEFLLTDIHYGTDFDLFMLYKHKEINVIPIVVQLLENGNLINPIQWFPKDGRGFTTTDEPRYVVLHYINKRQHYELLLPETGQAVVPQKELPGAVRDLVPSSTLQNLSDAPDVWMKDGNICKE